MERFRYIVIDGEHSPFTLASLRRLHRGSSGHPERRGVRISENDENLIKQTSTVGVDGIQDRPWASRERRSGGARIQYPALGIGHGRAAATGSMPPLPPVCQTRRRRSW